MSARVTPCEEVRRNIRRVQRLPAGDKTAVTEILLLLESLNDHNELLAHALLDPNNVLATETARRLAIMLSKE